MTGDLLWSGAVPDVPIAPPRDHSIGLNPGQVAAVTERVRKAMRHPTRVATPKHPPVRREDPPVRAAPAPKPPRTCACGCGRPLRPHNATGYSKFCKAQRYAIEVATNSAATAARACTVFVVAGEILVDGIVGPVPFVEVYRTRAAADAAADKLRAKHGGVLTVCECGVKEAACGT